MTSSGCLKFWDLTQWYNVSSNLYLAYDGYQDISWIASVNFDQVHLTPLMRLALPPPLSEKVIQLDQNPQTLAFYGAYLIAVLCKQILVIECESGKIFYSEEGNFEGVEKAIF